MRTLITCTANIDGDHRGVGYVVIGGRRLEDTNDHATPDRVTSTACTAHETTACDVRVRLPPASWTMLCLVAGPA